MKSVLAVGLCFCIPLALCSQGYLVAKCQGALSDSSSIGCVAQSLIPHDQSYWIEFKDEHEKSASQCFVACSTVFPNTSLALVYSNKTSLECRCALPSAIHDEYVGPDVFCTSSCPFENIAPCGGGHEFTTTNGSKSLEVFYNAYCLTNMSEPNLPTIATTTPTTTTTIHQVTTSGPPSNIHKVLTDILEVVAAANVTNIITIGLLVVIIILAIVVIAWCVLFFENYPFAKNEQKDTGPLGHHAQSYGTANQAFDPQPEADDFPERLENVLSNGIDFPTTDDDERVDDEVIREGRSTFYHGRQHRPADTISSTSTIPMPDSVHLDLKQQDGDGKSTFYYGERPEDNISITSINPKEPDSSDAKE